MAVSVSSMQAAFAPEYDNVDTGLIQICIDEAELRASSVNYGAKRDMAIRYLAGHLLDIRAGGQNARLQSDYNSTIKGKEYLYIMRTVSYGARVVG